MQKLRNKQKLKLLQLLRKQSKKSKKERLQRMQKKQKQLKHRLLLRRRKQNLMLSNNKTEANKVEMKGEAEVEDEVVAVVEEVDAEEAIIVVEAEVVNKIPMMISK